MNNTEREIIEAVYKAKSRMCTSYDVAVPNCFTQHDNEADLFFIRKSGLCDEVEIKVSRPDLLQDKKKRVRYREFIYPDDCDKDMPHIKPKHDALIAGEMDCNYFWYALKNGIGGIEDIPEWAGLIIVKDDGESSIIRSPKRLHRKKMSFEDRYKIARKASYRFWKSEFGIGL